MATPMGPIATIGLATLVAVVGAAAVIALDSTVADVIGVAVMSFGLVAILWAVLVEAGDPGSPE